MLASQTQLLVALGLMVANARAALDFLNPPQAGENKDYSSNPAYTEGDSITIAWSGSVEEGVPLTLAMLQQTLEGDGDTRQYIIIPDSVAGLNQYQWTVTPWNFNLTASNVFFLDIFTNRSTSPDTTSHYFNITAKAAASSTTTSSSGPTATTTPAGSLSTSVASAAATSTGTGAAAASGTAAASGGLSTGAKIGIGVGVSVPVALALGALAGWYLYRRKVRGAAAGGGPAYAAAAAAAPELDDGHGGQDGHPPPGLHGAAAAAGAQQGQYPYRDSKYSQGSQQQELYHHSGQYDPARQGVQVPPAQLDGHGLPAQLDGQSPNMRAYELQ